MGINIRVTSIHSGLRSGVSRLCVATLLVTSAIILPLQAQTANSGAPAQPAMAAPIPPGVIKSIAVVGNERLEPDTVRSYSELHIGDAYDATIIDAALKRIYAAELFADATIKVDEGKLTITVRENPVINRIVFEGAKRVKEDKLREEVRLAPRQIYTRTKVRADVGRMIEVYRRNGRFAATIEPKVIQLPQNRVDLVFEIDEGPKSKVRQINIIGNKKFSTTELRDAIYTRQARWYRLFTSNDTYDPDRLAADREKLRQFYLTNGYADFRISSAVAELTPDRKDFIITIVLEEGERYKFGKVDLESKIRDIKAENYRSLIPIKPGSWFNAKQIQDTIELLTNTAGLFGYAFVDVRPRVIRDKAKRIQNITFEIGEAPRVYIENIAINGNTRTEDRVARREFRLAEGDAFNSFKVKRSKERIQSLGYFQEKLEIEQKPGSTPDKVALEVNVEEKSTGQFNIGAGFSSLESFILNVGISQSNFLGKGQDIRANFELSRLRNQIDLSFTDPYAFDRNFAAGIDLFRRNNNNRFNGTFSSVSNTTTNYDETDLGFGLRAGFPVTEFWNYSIRYNLVQSTLTYGQATGATNGCFLDGPLRTVTTTDANGNPTTSTIGGTQPLSLFVCDSIGSRLISSIGHSFAYNTLNNNLQPSSGARFIFSQDLAGLGGNVRYIRTTANYDYFHPIYGGFVLRLGAQGGYIRGLGQNVRFVDHFFLGTPEFRGFQYRGLGPRSEIISTTTTTNADGTTTPSTIATQGDFLGGNIYYKATSELQIPLGSAAGELGLRTAAFVDIGSVFSLDPVNSGASGAGTITRILAGSDTYKPRIAVGLGVSWKSPFGPFRIDISKAIRKQPSDITETFQFNVGTTFQ